MNYPGGFKKNINNFKKKINYKNRGMSLEDDINITNKYYIDNNIAYIYKKPTPIKVVKAEFNNMGYRVIKELKTKFPLINIHPHQINHIRNIVKENGICFLIIRFTTLNKTFLLRGIDFIDYIDKNNISFIPLDYIEQYGELIKDKYLKRVDYLEIVDKLWRLK